MNFFKGNDLKYDSQSNVVKDSRPTIYLVIYANFKSLSLLISLEIDCFHSL